MKFHSLDDIVTSNSKAVRNLKPPDILAWYTQEQIDALNIKKYDRPLNALCDILYTEQIAEFKRNAKANNLLHRWSPKEDAFLEATYMYLSDATIGLALNLPTTTIKKRREARKFFKKFQVGLEVIVWNKRGSFEEDLQKEGLTKARPSILAAVTSIKEEV